MSLSRAKREKLKAAIAIIGPSGSGKTLSALLTAYGMMQEKYPDKDEDFIWSKVGLVDTEHKRSLLYEGQQDSRTHNVRIGQFWHYDLTKPYTLERYKNAVLEIKEAGAEVVIIDSLSHAWQGEGGILEYQQDLGGRYQDWKKTNKEQYFPLVSLAVGESTDIHTINTIRSKQSYQTSTTDTGKLEVKKLGLQPVQRDDFEFEFQIVLNTDMDHIARTSKDNSGMFEGRPEKIGPEHGNKLYSWLEEGKDVKAEEEAERQNLLRMIEGLLEEHEDKKELVSLILQLEQKAKMKVDNMSLKMVNRVHELLLHKLDEMETEADEVATSREATKG